VRGTAAVDDGTNSILVDEAKAHVLSDTHGPGVVKGSDENRRPFAKLKKAGLGRNGNTKELVVRFEFSAYMGVRRKMLRVPGGTLVAQAIRKAGIREVLFPDTWMIIPCSVRLLILPKC
jgi:hypothetical protein